MKRKPRRFCGEGHEMTAENTYIHNDSRHCRECRKMSSKERVKRNSKKKEELPECPITENADS